MFSRSKNVSLSQYEIICKCGRQASPEALRLALERKQGLRCGSCRNRIRYDEIRENASKSLVRKGHPETSREAAEAFAPKQRQSQLRALGYVSESPGSTANELAKLAGDRDTRKIGRRLPELESFGLVIRGDARRCSVTNRKAHTWYPADTEEKQKEG